MLLMFSMLNIQVVLTMLAILTMLTMMFMLTMLSLLTRLTMLDMLNVLNMLILLSILTMLATTIKVSIVRIISNAINKKINLNSGFKRGYYTESHLNSKSETC